MCRGQCDRDVKREAPGGAAVASAAVEEPAGAPASAADILHVHAGPADVSADVAANMSAAPRDVAGQSGDDNAAAVAPVEDVGVSREDAAAEEKSGRGNDSLVAGTTDEAVVVDVEGIQNA